MHALVAEAMRKAAIAWLTVADRPAYPVWCLWIDDALYVVSRGGPDSDEQHAPGLPDANTALVGTRGDHGGQIVTWRADVKRVTPDDERWNEIATQLAAKRLNSTGTNEALVERWTTTAVVTRLTPADDDIVPTGDGSGAAPPPESPASKRTDKPFKLHRVKKRRQG